MATFHSGRWNAGTNPNLAFVSVGPASRVPDRRILEKFPRPQYRPSLTVPPRLALPVPRELVKRWNFRKAYWSHYNALTNNLLRVFRHQIYLIWIWPTRNSAMPSEQQPKILSHAVVEITTYRVEMLSARTSTGHFYSRLKEETLTRLPQPYTSGSTRNAEIDGPRQFRLLTFRTLAEKHGVY